VFKISLIINVKFTSDCFVELPQAGLTQVWLMPVYNSL